MAQGITVTCYAGYKGDERPTSFQLGDRTLVVAEVIDRWYDQDYNCFKVMVEDGTQYLLRHDMNQDAGSWCRIAMNGAERRYFAGGRDFVNLVAR